MLNSLELVKIEWDDASALEHGWTTDGSYVNGRFQIPKGMIKTITPLQKKRKKTGGIAPPVAAEVRTQ